MKSATNSNNQGEIDFRFLFSQIRVKWPILLICIFITTIIGWYHLKTANITYEGKVSLFLEDRTMKNPLDVQSLIGIQKGNIASSIDNEQELLKSTEMIKNAIKNTDWRVSFFQIKKMTTVDLYNNAPFIVNFDSTSIFPVDAFFNIEIISNKEFKIKCDQSASLFSYLNNEYLTDKSGEISKTKINFDKTYNFGDTISNANFKFVIGNKSISKDDEGRKFKFKFNNLDNLAKNYSKSISIKPSSENSSVLIIKFVEANPIRLKNIINSLAQEYIKFDLKRKNEVAIKTIQFIDSELSSIKLDLSSSESNLESYKINNRFLDLGKESENVFSSFYNIDGQKSNLEILKKYYLNIKKAIETNKDASDIALPSNAGSDDPILLTLLNNYITLTNEKINLKATAKDKNPVMIQINSQILQARKNILDLVINKLDNINLTLDYFNKKEASINSKITILPTNQRSLIGFERTFNLQNQLFIFLLQRRAEAQITAATNVSDSFIIDPCKDNSIIEIKEDISKTYSISTMIGLIVALLIIFGPSFILDHFSSEKEIENASPFPVIGFIPHSTENSINIITENPRSMVSEALRKLRTNINYISQGDNNFILLLASDMPQSGKTFTTLNLAYTYAISNKKTLVISADMRKNEILNFNIENIPIFGLSDYLSKSATLDEIIAHSENDNLFVIHSGTLPPNPAELLESNRCKELFAILKTQFEIVIIDTPAISLFADTSILMDYSDINIFIVRIKQSNKSLVKSIFKDWQAKSAKKPAVIINDIVNDNSTNKQGYYYYGYGYDQKKTTFLTRLFYRIGIRKFS
jgi:capsular exopolysaccharide synthesis family protein